MHFNTPRKTKSVIRNLIVSKVVWVKYTSNIHFRSLKINSEYRILKRTVMAADRREIKKLFFCHFFLIAKIYSFFFWFIQYIYICVCIFKKEEKIMQFFQKLAFSDRVERKYNLEKEDPILSIPLFQFSLKKKKILKKVI